MLKQLLEGSRRALSLFQQPEMKSGIAPEYQQRLDRMYLENQMNNSAMQQELREAQEQELRPRNLSPATAQPPMQGFFGDKPLGAAQPAQAVTTRSLLQNSPGTLQDFVPEQYRGIVEEAANTYNIPPRLLAAKIMQESSWNTDPDLRSSAGALGVSQFMPETAQWWAKQYGDFDPLIPEQAIPAGAAYLDYVRQQIGREGTTEEDWIEALKGYNAGPGNYRKYGGQIPFEETIDYINKISGYYR